MKPKSNKECEISRGGYFRKACEELYGIGVSNVQLAKEFGCSEAAIRNWENGAPLIRCTQAAGTYSLGYVVISLRYTFITELIANGADIKTVQYLAGHKSIQTTLSIYAQVKGGKTDDAIDLLSW